MKQFFKNIRHIINEMNKSEEGIPEIPLLYRQTRCDIINQRNERLARKRFMREKLRKQIIEVGVKYNQRKNELYLLNEINNKVIKLNKNYGMLYIYKFI